MEYRKKIKEIESIEFLKKIGLLIPFDKNLNLYHGRASKKEEFNKWKVKKGFVSKNMNVYNIPILSTGVLKTAEEFAMASVRECISTFPEIYKIVTYAPNALFYNDDFDITKLSQEQQKQLIKTMRILLPNSYSSISEMVPVRFEDREWYVNACSKLLAQTFTTKYITFDMIDEYYKKEGEMINKETLTQIAGCINSRTLMIQNPQEMLSNFVFAQNKITRERKTITENGKRIEIPINMDYIASWSKSNDIIGTKKTVHSGTLDKEIEGFYIYDLDKIVTEQTLKEREKEKTRTFGLLTKYLKDFSALDIEKVLKDSTPQESVEYLKQFDGCKKLLDGDSGVHEKFTVGEHTETVLRIFEDSFRDDLPQQLLPFMKIVILSHDIGKAVFADNPYNGLGQKYYNKKACEKLMQTLKVDSKIKDLVLFIIGDSQTYTNNYYINKIPNAKKELTKECSKILKEVFGCEPDKDIVEGLEKMCIILQTCDGGAYTRYAITRDQEKDFYYTNWSVNFTKSFAKPKDLRHREIKFPEENE